MSPSHALFLWIWRYFSEQLFYSIYLFKMAAGLLPFNGFFHQNHGTRVVKVCVYTILTLLAFWSRSNRGTNLKKKGFSISHCLTDTTRVFSLEFLKFFRTSNFIHSRNVKSFLDCSQCFCDCSSFFFFWFLSLFHFIQMLFYVVFKNKLFQFMKMVVF